jgi:hypothetical protein
MMVLDLNVVDLPYKRHTKIHKSQLTLIGPVLEYHFQADCQVYTQKEPDKDPVWEDLGISCAYTTKRENITGVQCSLDHISNLWIVTLELAGAFEDIVVLYNIEDLKKANALYAQLKTWWLEF